jgi:hypothetical protein
MRAGRTRAGMVLTLATRAHNDPSPLADGTPPMPSLPTSSPGASPVRRLRSGMAIRGAPTPAPPEEAPR